MATFIIAPDYTLIGNSYTITVTAVDTLGGSLVQTFSVVVVNLPPTFSTAPATQTIPAGGTSTYTLPAAVDPELGTVTIMTLTSTAPFTVTVAGFIVSMSPLSTDAGTYSATVTLFDGAVTSTATFSIVVFVSSPPSFNTAPVDQSLNAGTPVSYILPAFTLYGANPGTIILNSGPSFASLSGTTLAISPLFTTAAGTYPVSISLDDVTFNVPYYFNIIVINLPPFYTGYTAGSYWSLGACMSWSAGMTASTDPEGGPVTVTVVTGPSWLTVPTILPIT